MNVIPIKCKCGSTSFTIRYRPECAACEYNGYEEWDEDGEEYEYRYAESKRGDRERVQVDDTGCCFWDEAFGGGCNMLTCTECGKVKILPYSVC